MPGLRALDFIRLSKIFLLSNVILAGLTIICPSSSHAAPPALDEVLVRFKQGVTETQARTIAADKAMDVIKYYSFLSDRKGQVYMLLRADNSSVWLSSGVEWQMISILKKVTNVEYVSPNYARAPLKIPNDPNFIMQWGLQNTGQTILGIKGIKDSDIHAPAAWDVSTGSSGAVIAVIDSGVDYSHEDVAANIWSNPGEIPGDAIDNDGNGYKDDVYGFDFASDILHATASDPMDIENHGTHVSGIAAAAGNNSKGISGVNWNARIMALKAMSPDGFFYDSNTIEAIQYATIMKARGVNIVAINASWGGSEGGQKDLLKDAISEAAKEGIVFVAAVLDNSENLDINPVYPASYLLPNIISVAATDQKDSLAAYSDKGPHSVDIAAPGENILSSIAHCIGCNNTEAFISVGGSTVQAKTAEFSKMTAGLTATGYNCGQGLAGDFPAAVNGNIAIVKYAGSAGSAGSPTPISNIVNRAISAGAKGVVIYYSNTSYDSTPFTLEYLSKWLPVVSISNSDGQTLSNMNQPIITIVTPPYDYYDGTSMAAAFVSGAVALASAPYSSEDIYQRIDRILSGVDTLASLSGKISSSGRLNISNSMQSTLTLAPLVTSLSRTTGLLPTATFTISGIEFGGSVGKVRLSSNAGPVDAAIVSWTDTSITASVPDGAGKYVSVLRPDGKESVKKFPVSAWQSKRHAGEERTYSTASLYSNKIYVFGGYHYQKDPDPDYATLGSAEVYNVATDTWTNVAAMPQPREMLASATLGDKIYLAGGFDEISGYLASVDVYDTKTDTYATLRPSPLPKASSELAMINLNDVLYISGGDTELDYATNIFYKYDSTTDAWLKLTSMSTARSGHGMVALNNKIYVFGGFDNALNILKSGEVYDPSKAIWSSIADMPIPLAGMGVATDGKYIFVTGGESVFYSPAKVFMRYDPSVNKWSYQPADINETIISKSFAPALYVPSYGIYSIMGSTSYTPFYDPISTNEIIVLQTPMSGAVSPTAYDFGQIDAGNSSAPKTFTIANTGSGGLAIGTISVSGDQSFSLLNGGCSGQSLAVSASCTFDVVFAPTSGGIKTASVLLPSNAAPTPISSVSLSGISTIALGDVDGSGTITIIDALYVARYAAGLSVGTFFDSAADVNCKDGVTIADALIIARKVAGFSVPEWCGL